MHPSGLFGARDGARLADADSQPVILLNEHIV